MATPFFDEQLIVDLLKSTVNVDNVGRIQQGAVQALVDLYDRKVTRDEFTTMASLCLALYSQAGKLWVLGNIEAVYAAGDLDTKRFATAREQLVEIMRKQCEGVIDIVKRLQLCPNDEDKVH
jgi:hypothetical protein